MKQTHCLAEPIAVLASEDARPSPRIVVITPARNEVELLPGLIESVVAQSLRPTRWVLVDDGSTDGTWEVMEAAAAAHGWITAVRRRDRGQRVLGGGVVAAFNEGLDTVAEPWDFVGKLDADLTFGPSYLERIIGRFERDPRLGSASGKVFRPEAEGEVEEFMIDEMVAGQWKLYRREAFEAIGGLVPAVMWDGIDFHRLRQAGWRTQSMRDKELRILHHRLMGSSDRGVLRGRRRHGRGQWFMGTHPLYMFASAVLRMSEKPRLIGGLMMLTGYLESAMRGRPRYADAGFRRELRSWQKARLLRLVSKGVVR